MTGTFSGTPSDFTSPVKSVTSNLSHRFVDEHRQHAFAADETFRVEEVECGGGRHHV
jgi:hypothetical protein